MSRPIEIPNKKLTPRVGDRVIFKDHEYVTQVGTLARWNPGADGQALAWIEGGSANGYWAHTVDLTVVDRVPPRLEHDDALNGGTPNSGGSVADALCPRAQGGGGEVVTDLTDRPDDVVEGVAPGYESTEVRVDAYRCTCGYLTLGADDMAGHLTYGHPASRNPEITCHAPATWDHERWCVRRKGHDGKHWTPSFHGGKWWP